jgi:hypothetical protein
MSATAAQACAGLNARHLDEYRCFSPELPLP